MSEAADALADRIRAIFDYRPGLTEKKMFGGYGFMLNGNMVAGAMRSGNLLLRVGPDLHELALQRPGTSAMHQGGRDMVGFVEVAPDFIDSEEDLGAWLDFAEGFVKTLPPK